MEKMEKIELHNIDDLKTQNDLPDIPELVQRYLDTKERKAKGKYFRIVIDERSDPKPGAGIAYSNALRIEKRKGESWVQVYSTGMMQYRGAYASEIDDRDLSLNDPTIFEESKGEMVYALRTGAGNVKVYRFRKESSELITRFNVRNHQAIQKRIDLLERVIFDAEAFRSYVSEGLGNRWYTASEISVWEDDCQIFNAAGKKLKGNDYDKVADKGEVVVLLARHADRDYDAITDSYRLFVWVKGRGIGSMGIYGTGLRHPAGRFYRIDIGFNTNITDYRRNFLNLTVEVGNKSQQWKELRTFHVKWKNRARS